MTASADYAEMIEDAVTDGDALARLREQVMADQEITDAQREDLTGLCDRYQDDLRLENEAVETTAMIDALDEDAGTT